MNKNRCAHVFLIQEGDPKKHHQVLETSKVRIEIYAVDCYEKGEALSKQLVDDGILLIELCESWGYEGAARISRAVQHRVPVGVITHPQQNARGLSEIMKGSENTYNK